MVTHRKRSEIHEGTPLRSWLYGVCVRVSAAQRRKASVRREIPSEISDSIAESGKGPEATLQDRESLNLLHNALDRLDDDKRAAFVLFELEQLSMKEVAEVLACPLQTAYSRHRAARDEVVKALRKGDAS